MRAVPKASPIDLVSIEVSVMDISDENVQTHPVVLFVGRDKILNLVLLTSNAQNAIKEDIKHRIALL